MVKTTVYLPEHLKRALAAVARQRSVSEAELIRQAISAAVAGEVDAEWGPIYDDDTLLADHVDEHLAGFGQR